MLNPILISHKIKDFVTYYFCFFYICIVSVLLLISNIKNNYFVKQSYFYKLNSSDDEKLNSIKLSANVYKLANNIQTDSKRVLIFLSGGFVSSFDNYIAKTILDLINFFPVIMHKYDIYIYEKTDKTYIELHDDIISYIENLNKIKKIDELILFGFSAGGVVCSHVMSRLKDFSFKKKIITYDTPYSVFKTIRSFKTDFLRADKYFSKIAEKYYYKHLNYDKIKDKIKTDWSIGYDSSENNIMEIHDLTYMEFAKICSMNYDLDKDVRMINIISKNDPIAKLKYIEHSIKKYKSKINFKLYLIKKNNISHCSDMYSIFEFFGIRQLIPSYNTKYLDHIIKALEN